MSYVIAWLAFFALLTGNPILGLILFMIASGVHKK
jgi:hypothetical protein